MKQLLKLFSIVFCAMALYACGSDDEPGKSALQDQFIDVDNSEYTEGSMPVGDTPMLQTATFDKAALPGGTSYLTLNSYEELDYVNIGVEGESGYLKVKLDAPIIRKSKFPQNPKRSVRFSGKRTKRSVQKRKARNTQKAETKVL